MRIEHFKEIDSTSAELRRRAEAGDLTQVWIQADRQTAGIGRRGREWTSVSGNLFCSGLYVHGGDVASAALLSFTAALAVAETCDAYVDPASVSIKWPNDIRINGAKVAGILLESGQAENQLWVCVGIGINLVSHPDDMPYAVTNLSAHIDSNDPEDIPTPMPALAILANRFEHWHDVLTEQGFAPLKAAWLARATGMGETVTANLMDRRIIGTMIGLGDKGELKVRLPDGTVTLISSGEVFFGSAHAAGN